MMIINEWYLAWATKVITWYGDHPIMLTIGLASCAVVTILVLASVVWYMSMYVRVLKKVSKS